MIMMTLIDLINNYVNPSLFILFLCIINIFLWRLINQARESIRANNTIENVEKEEEESIDSITAVKDKDPIIGYL